MNFKEQRAADLAVFVNPDEFADNHNIDGTQVLCVIDDDETLTRSDRQTEQYEGIYKRTIILYVRESILGYRPVYGQDIKVDGLMYGVNECSEKDGLLTVTLEANTS